MLLQHEHRFQLESNVSLLANAVTLLWSCLLWMFFDFAAAANLCWNRGCNAYQKCSDASHLLPSLAILCCAARFGWVCACLCIMVCFFLCFSISRILVCSRSHLVRYCSICATWTMLACFILLFLLPWLGGIKRLKEPKEEVTKIERRQLQC